jgi:hypothetical protein
VTEKMEPHFYADGRWVFDSTRPRKIQSGRNKHVCVAQATTEVIAKLIAEALSIHLTPSWHQGKRKGCANG